MRLHRWRLWGTITDYEDPNWATIQSTLWHYGPPPRPYHIHGRWEWDDVRFALETGQPLEWM